MSVHEITPNREIRVIKKDDRPDTDPDEDLRRAMLRMLGAFKRRFPNDWPRLVAEADSVKAA